MRAIRYGEDSENRKQMPFSEFQSAMRAIRYGGGIHHCDARFSCSFNPLCVQLDMVEDNDAWFAEAKIKVSIRYACN